MSLYIKGILRAPGRLTADIDNARIARQNLMTAEKRALAQFNSNTQKIINGLSGTSKFVFESAGKIVGETANFGLRFLGPDEGTKIYRNATKSGSRMLAKGAHGLIHGSLLGLRGASAKVYVRVKTRHLRESYNSMRKAALVAM